VSEAPLTIIYKAINRDLGTLQEACSSLKMTLRVVECEEELGRELNRGTVSCIIVPLGPDEECSKIVSEFTSTVAKILQPEDADITIIYSTERLTPANWTVLGRIDPRPIQSHDYDQGPQLVTEDIQWKETIKKLKSLTGRIRYVRNPMGGIVKTEFKRITSVPFPTEPVLLLRAAFKDMSRISVRFPKQGLSGSIACIIQPYNVLGKKCKQVFVKIYPDQEKAQRELSNYTTYVEPYIESSHYPGYQHFRRYRGKAYSLMVTELSVGPNSNALTLREMIFSPAYSVEQIKNFISDLLLAMGKWPLTKRAEKIDLFNEYLAEVFTNEDKKIKLESENVYPGWFGDVADSLSLEGKIRKTLPEASLRGKFLRICHGDLHADNIMVKDVGGRLIPVLIDFSRTEQTHSIKDLVTLEADMVIRGLCGTGGLHERVGVQSFLELLSVETENGGHEKQDSSDGKNSSQLGKVRLIIRKLRKNAFSTQGIPEIEYAGAALLKTLEILCYGKLPHEQNEKATTYVSYLCGRIRRLSKV